MIKYIVLGSSFNTLTEHREDWIVNIYDDAESSNKHAELANKWCEENGYGSRVIKNIEKYF